MKKVLLVAAVASLAMVSCKKSYTCTCKDTTANPDPDVVIKGTATKKDAKKVCDNANTTYSPGGYSCTLAY